MPSDDLNNETTPSDSGVNPTTSDLSNSQTQNLKTNGMDESMNKPWSEQKLEEVKQIQEAFRTRVSMRDLVVDDDVHRYLSLSRTEMRKLPHWECAEACLLIHQAALHVQSEMNRHITRMKWAEECVTRLIAPRITRYGNKFTPYDYRRQMAVRDNEAALAVEGIRVKNQICVDEMSFIPTQMRQIADAYAELAQAKRYTRETS